MIYKLKFLFEAFEDFIKNIYDSFISIIKILLLSKFNVCLPVAKEKDCIVLGNGPSLRKAMDNSKDFFRDKSLFCVNGFPSSPEYVELKPANIVWLDPMFYIFKDKKILEEKRPDLIQLFNDVTEKTSWPTVLFLPSLAKKAIYLKEIAERNSNIKINYFNYTIVKSFPFMRHFLFKLNLGMPLCQNVLGVCIFLSLNMGHKKIYLFGADHSWMKDVEVNEVNEVYLLHKHFYEGKSVTIPVKYAIGKEKVNMARFLELFVKTFTTYYILEKYAVSLKTKIYNSTEGSFIDAFERVKSS